jgi:uncharacterized protein
MRFFIVVALTLMALVARAEFKVPPLTGPVVDNGELITAHDEELLNSLIRQFRQTHQVQMQILTVPSLEGDTIEQASIKVTDAWKLGDQKRDDGLLIFVAANERKIRIEVGQGLEGVIPDVTAHRVISDVMVPMFRQGNSSQAIVLGTYQLMKIIDHDFTGEEALQKYDPDQRTLFQRYEGLFILLFVLLILFLNMLTPRGRRYRGVGGGFGGGNGDWRIGSGGGGWGGGGFGGGGGWSGGGGGFSGGGASGGW